MTEIESIIWLVTGCIIASAFLPLPFIAEFMRRIPRSDASIDRKLLMFSLILILFGIASRIYLATIVFDGHLTADEIGMSRLYVYKAITGGKYISGATQYFQGMMLSWWYIFFGVSAYSARMFTVVCSILGIFFYYKCINLLFGRRVALISAVLISISPYAILFSSLALECNSVVLFMPVIIYQYIIWERAPDTVRSISLGLLIGLSSLTYPGHVLGLICFFGSVLFCSMIQKSINFSNLKRVRHCLLIIFSFALVLVISIILHSNLNAGNKFLFAGGAPSGFSFTLSNLLIYFIIILHDLLVEVTTWYGILDGAALVEKTWLVISIFGVGLAWKFDKRNTVKALAASLVLIVFLVPFTGHPMGIRRGLYIFIPLFAFAALGINQIINMAGYSWLKFCVLLAVMHSLLYDIISIPVHIKKPYASGFCTLTLPDNIVEEYSKKGDIFLNKKEFYFYIDQDLNTSYLELLKHYNPQQYQGKIFFTNLENINLSDKSTGLQTYFSWNPDVYGFPVKDHNKCYDMENIKFNFFTKQINLLKFSITRETACKYSDTNQPFVQNLNMNSGRGEYQKEYRDLIFLPSCQS